MRMLAGVLSLLLVLAGCGGEGTPGGPGAKKTDDNKGKLSGLAEETFTLDTPTLATSLKQGESKKVTIGIKRGKNFDEDVTLKFENLPDGVTIEPASPKIPKAEKDTTITVKAAADAAVNDDLAVNVIGQPTKGEPAKTQLKLKVTKSD